MIFNNEKKYLLALLDDRSRFIVGYGISDFKTSIFCIDVFKKAIDTYTKPLVYWSDNGTENKSEIMKKFCDDNSISQVFTIPGNLLIT